MAVLLVRHADAGDRDRWDAPDDLRPLTAKGEHYTRKGATWALDEAGAQHLPPPS